MTSPVNSPPLDLGELLADRDGPPVEEAARGPLTTVAAAPPVERPRLLLGLALFLATFFSTTTVGAFWTQAIRTDVVTDLAPYGVPLVGPATVARVWSDPQLLLLGLQFSLPTLLILLCHEMGHYLTCRRNRVAATIPYFLPLPAIFGTLGAFIKVKAPIRTKRILFDIGAAGPFAGFVALLPFLLAGIAWSTPTTLVTGAEAAGRPVGLLPVPGQSLAMELTTRFFHGELAPDQFLDLHPFALAAWFGLLATALNLMPFGQLDGGHILYAALPGLQHRLAPPLWIALLAVGLFYSPAWILWCVIILVVMRLRHPPVQDETEPLDRPRRWAAVAALVVLILSFMPTPLYEGAIAIDPALLGPSGEPAPAGTEVLTAELRTAGRAGAELPSIAP